MRAIVFYLICFLVIWKVLDTHKLMGNTVPTTLSRLTPPVDYFAGFMDRHDHYDDFKLMNCINYHKAVAYFFDFQRADAEGMLGFCYERLGHEGLAVESYRQAIASNADYFWPYYDLGVIYYRKGQYPKAEDYFGQALNQNPVKNYILLSRSKVYNDVRLSKENGTYDFLQGLKEGRTNAYMMMLDSFFKSSAWVELGNAAVYGIKEGMDTHGLFYYFAGVSLFYQKSYPKAVEFLQLAIQNDPTNADAFAYLGMCLHALGNEPMAQIMMHKASQLHQQGGLDIKQFLKPDVRFF
jgi:tetratricopeptide (TPR) repeat protein